VMPVTKDPIPELNAAIEIARDLTLRREATRTVVLDAAGVAKYTSEAASGSGSACESDVSPATAVVRISKSSGKWRVESSVGHVRAKHAKTLNLAKGDAVRMAQRLVHEFDYRKVDIYSGDEKIGSAKL